MRPSITIFLCQQRRHKHTACTASQRERISSKPLWKLVSGVAHVLLGVVQVPARTTDQSYELCALRPTSFASHNTGFARLEVPLFVAIERCTNPRNSTGAICAARNPARQLILPANLIAQNAKLDALALNRRATRVKGCISYIDTTHESNLHVRTRVVSTNTLYDTHAFNT